MKLCFAQYTFLFLIGALAVVSMSITGCKLGPEPSELIELERMLLDPNISEIRDTAGATRFYQEARQFRQLSREAHSDRKEELSREYALLGTLRYRTAVAIVQQHAAKARLDEANARITALNPQVRATNEERHKLVQYIKDLENRIAAANRQRREAFETASGAAFADGNNATADDATRSLRQAEQARRDASAVRADEFAASLFDRADGQLRQAKEMLQHDPKPLGDIILAAGNAITLFNEAHKISLPEFEEYQRKMQPQARIEAIQEEAKNLYGEPFVVSEHNGVRIVLALMFEREQADFRAGTQSMLENLVNVAQNYEEFSIFIEGFTARRGDVTQNLVVSQLRAHRVRDYLRENGIAFARIQTEGFGQDRLRFAENADKNDRVEVIFRRSVE